MKSFDFDVAIAALRSAPDARRRAQDATGGREAAKMDGSFNLAGIKDPVIDALIDKVIEAKSRAELIDRLPRASTACCAQATIGCHSGTRPRTTSPFGTVFVGRP